MRLGLGLAPKGFVWKLRRAMNGTRPASKAFCDLVRQHMKEYGLECVTIAAMVFHEAGRDISLLVHGDDFFACAEQGELDTFGMFLESRFRIKFVGMIGPGVKARSSISSSGQ